MNWEEHAEKWPKEIEKAQRGLNSPMAKGIFVYLLTHKDKTFSELSNDLEIKSNKLSYHLKRLVRNGLLSHMYAHEENRQDHSFYSVSNFGNIYAKKCLEAAHHPYQYQHTSKVEIPSFTTFEEFNVRKMTGILTSQEAPPVITIEQKSDKRVKKEKDIHNLNFTTDEETTTNLIIKGGK